MNDYFRYTKYEVRNHVHKQVIRCTKKCVQRFQILKALCGVAIRIRKFPVQNPLGTQSGFGIQPCFKTPGDIWAEIIETQ